MTAPEVLEGGERLKVTDAAAPVREEGGAVETAVVNADSANERLVHAIDLIARGLYLARGGTEDAYKVEGGEGSSVYGGGKVHRRINEVRGEAYRVVMAWRKSDPFSSMSALATREAPAGAGESPLVDWFSRFVEAHQEGCGPDTDALISCLDRIRDSYRAQPQAREEAQPDTDCVSLLADLDAGKSCGPEAAATIRSLIRERDQATLPAPEAEKLRDVVSAAKEVCLAAATERFERIHCHPAVEALEEALAALQAEQKGGA